MFKDDRVETGSCLRASLPAEDDIEVFILAITHR